jgi:hypothetical protein
MDEYERPKAGPRKRWLLWSGLALSLLVIAGGGLVWLAQPGPMERVSRQVRPGMTYEQVEVLVGKNGQFSPLAYGNKTSVGLGWWSGDDGDLLVFFDTAKLATEAIFTPTDEPSRLQRVRNRLRSWLGCGPPPRVPDVAPELTPPS